MNSSNFCSDTSGLPLNNINHSTSVNTLFPTGAPPGLVTSENNYRAGLNPQLFNRFSPHEGRTSASQHQNLHSQSTANSTAPSKLSFRGPAVTTTSSSSSNNRQSATNGIKLAPSTQHGTWVNNEPQVSTTQSTSGHSTLLALSSQNPHPSSKRQKMNLSSVSSVANSSGHSGLPSNREANREKTTSSQGLHNTISHLKDKHQRPGLATQFSLKQTKSFTQSVEAVQSGANFQPNQKPPSSKHQSSIQQTRAGESSASTTNHHEADAIGQPKAEDLISTDQHQSLSHTRTQQSLGIKHLSGQTLLHANSRQQLKPAETSFKVNRESLANKRTSETFDFEKKGPFAKQNRMSQQIVSSVGLHSLTINSSSRLATQKNSVADDKKPGSTAVYSLSNQHKQASTHLAQQPSHGTPSSQIVSAHSYQANAQQSVSQHSSMVATSKKTATPTSGAAKSYKPPLDSTKHGHSVSLLATNVAANSSSSLQRHSVVRTSNETTSSSNGGKRSSPRSQLHVFTKKQLHEVSSKHSATTTSLGLGAKHSFSHAMCSNTFSPSDEVQSKRRSSEVKSLTLTKQSLNARSLKTQVVSNASRSTGTQDPKKSTTHQQSSQSFSQTNNSKSRNTSTKVSVTSGHNNAKENHQIKVGNSMLNPKAHSNQNVELTQPATDQTPQQPDQQMYSSTQSHKSQVPQSTKHTSSTNGIFANSSSSVTMKSVQSSGASNEVRSGEANNSKVTGQREDNQKTLSSAKLNVAPSFLNAYKQRSASPSEPVPSQMNTSQPAAQSSKTTSLIANLAIAGVPQNSVSTLSATKGNFSTHVGHQMVQNRVPQFNSGLGTSGGSTESYSNHSHQQTAQTSVVSHQLKMKTAHQGVQNHLITRQVRSATRAQEIEAQVDSENKQTGIGGKSSVFSGHNGEGAKGNNMQHKLTTQKVTDRPQSASAGQKFIGRQQNLKELFEKNWQSVNVQNKVDPQSGEATQIRTLTVVDTNSMVHEDQQEAAALPLAPGTRIIIPNHEPTKCSNKRNGIVRAYAANTNQGLVRNYNEDRVSIILNIVKPEHRKHETWPTCSFFGVYDGHGGSACAEFLRDNLHHFVIKEESFPWEPEEAIRRGFEKAEARFLDMCQAKDETTGKMTVIERSGSCAIVVLIVGEICYVANVGDSRAVLSSGAGQSSTALSRDHKPSDIEEYKRIVKAGGQIYQTTTSQIPGQKEQLASLQKDGKTADQEFIVGPIRVLPGRLSVCRTFGDPEAKLEYRGGNPNVVKAEPDIRSFQISKQHDFIVLASDGIYDKLSDDDIGKAVWLTCEAARQAKSAHSAGQVVTQQHSNNISVHQYCGLGVEGILKNSLMRQSLDNVTVVMVAFQNFKRVVCGTSSIRSAEKHSETKQQQKEKEESQLPSQKRSLARSASEQQENQNFRGNNKNAGVRSHQKLLARNQNDRYEVTQDRQLARQSANDHQLTRQRNQEDADHQRRHSQPRTRSQNADGQIEQDSMAILQQKNHKDVPSYSIRQQQQASKIQQTGVAGQTSSLTKTRDEDEQQVRALAAAPQITHLSGEGFRQIAKPPISNNAGSTAQTKGSKFQREQSQQIGPSGTPVMRSLSLKETAPLQGAQSHTGTSSFASGAFHSRLNQLANLNSNKSLEVAAHQTTQFCSQTPPNQVSVGSQSSGPGTYIKNQVGYQNSSFAPNQPAHYNNASVQPSQIVSGSGGVPSPAFKSFGDDRSGGRGSSLSTQQRFKASSSSTAALIFGQTKA